MDNTKELIKALDLVLAQEPSEEWLIGLYNETEKFQVSLPLPKAVDYTLHVRSGDFYRTIILTRTFRNKSGIPTAVHKALNNLLAELKDEEQSSI